MLFTVPARGKKAKGCGTELLEEAAGGDAAIPCNIFDHRLSCLTPVYHVWSRRRATWQVLR
jgi:hypothetical protein